RQATDPSRANTISLLRSSSLRKPPARIMRATESAKVENARNFSRLFNESKYRNESFPVAVNSASSYIKFKLGSQRQIYKRREQLKVEICNLFNSTIAYGPFTGLKFSSDAWWGRERASMMLGLYEQEVLESLW